MEQIPNKPVPKNIKMKLKASLTVEAAFAFPVFFFACMALCYLFVFLKTEYVIQREIYETAKDISGYGVIIEPVAKYRNKILSDAETSLYGDSGIKKKSDIIESLSSLLPSAGNGISLKNLISNAADSLIIGAILEGRLSDEVIKYLDPGGGILNCDGSVLYDYDKCLFIKCSYDLVLPLGIFPNIKIPVTHTLRYRYFTGTDVVSLLEEAADDTDEGDTEEEKEEEEEEEEEEKVLITDTGTCYHYSRSCPALNVRPTAVSLEAVGSKRNNGGGKYKPCEFCALHKQETGTCYITPEGDRYHFDKSCQGLKRTIYEVPLSEVGKKRECKRCKNMKDKNN